MNTKQSQQASLHVLSLAEVRRRFPAFASLYARLLPTVPKRLVTSSPSNFEVHTQRTFSYDGMKFSVPPTVHKPGFSSELLFNYLASLDLTGKTVVAMGVGCGVEAVIAARRNAQRIVALDINPISIKSTKENYASLVPKDTKRSRLIAVRSDLFQKMPWGMKADVITFNPPAVYVNLSTDEDVIRNACIGTSILRDFFQQIHDNKILVEKGQALLMLTTVTEIKKIVSFTLRLGFLPAIIRESKGQGHHDDITRYLFSFMKKD
jgi:release factor glutamine methyltransferase